jgi:hypothetical protein
MTHEEIEKLLEGDEEVPEFVYAAIVRDLLSQLKSARRDAFREAIGVMISVGRERCASRGVDPDSEVFDHECDHIKAMAEESIACTEYIADILKEKLEGE